MHEVCADELALHLVESNVGRERSLHFDSALFERRQQIAVSALEIFENLGQLLLCDLKVEAEHAIHDVIGPRFVRRFEVSRFRSGFEAPH